MDDERHDELAAQVVRGKLMERDLNIAIDPSCFAALQRGLVKMQRVAA